MISLPTFAVLLALVTLVVSGAALREITTTGVASPSLTLATVACVLMQTATLWLALTR